jgi:hypothetical protein
VVHASIGGGWALDLAATSSLGTLAYVGIYLALGLTAAERRGLGALIARVRAR